MTDNITKLYELAGIKKKRMCDWICQNSEVCDADCKHFMQSSVHYPPFSVEKQLELIKWLAHKAHNGLLINKHITDGGASMVFDNLGYKTTLASSFISFEECLTKLVNNLWQDLAEKQKQEIKRILE